MRVTEYYIVDAGINSSTISITIQTLQPGIYSLLYGKSITNLLTILIKFPTGLPQLLQITSVSISVSISVQSSNGGELSVCCTMEISIDTEHYTSQLQIAVT